MRSPGARRPAQRKRRPDPAHKPFVAPSGGWVTAVNLALAKPGTAKVLENWIPTTTGIRLRAGCVKHGTASADEPLESTMAYIGTSTREMFAAADGDILDLTAPADPDVVPTPVVTGQASNYYSHINFTNPAGTNYLMCANGSDDIQTYDGSTWAALVTGAGVGQLNGLTSSTVDHLNVYRNHIWLMNRTMTAYYLPTDQIAGTVGEVALAGVFRRGGYIMFSATWSMDAGDGLDDKIVFVSSEGEVAVYQGDPVDATTWGIVGLYDCSPPLGKNAFLKVGGDLLILTEIGLVPLSAIISKDAAALALAAVSRNIQPDWLAESQARRLLPWEIVKWTSRNVAYISCPVTSDNNAPICFAVNLETGAWSKVTGWNTRCFILHDDGVYFGTNAGTLMRAEVSGSDDGELIYHTYVGHMDHLGAIGQHKTVLQARAIFLTKTAFIPLVAVTTDYEQNLPSAPSAAIPTGNPGEWDVGLWDVSTWDAGTSYFTVNTHWTSIGLSGFAHAPIILVTSGAIAPPTAELVMFDTTYETGGLVV